LREVDREVADATHAEEAREAQRLAVLEDEVLMADAGLLTDGPPSQKEACGSVSALRGSCSTETRQLSEDGPEAEG
jgi:hypothetical protein